MINVIKDNLQPKGVMKNVLIAVGSMIGLAIIVKLVAGKCADEQEYFEEDYDGENDDIIEVPEE